MVLIRIEKKDTLEIHAKAEGFQEVCWEYTKDLTKARLKGTRSWVKVKKFQQKQLRRQLYEFQRWSDYGR